MTEWTMPTVCKLSWFCLEIFPGYILTQATRLVIQVKVFWTNRSLLTARADRRVSERNKHWIKVPKKTNATTIPMCHGVSACLPTTCT